MLLAFFIFGTRCGEGWLIIDWSMTCSHCELQKWKKRRRSEITGNADQWRHRNRRDVIGYGLLHVDDTDFRELTVNFGNSNDVLVCRALAVPDRAHLFLEMFFISTHRSQTWTVQPSLFVCIALLHHLLLLLLLLRILCPSLDTIDLKGIGPTSISLWPIKSYFH